jgi:hypothetical protein
MERQEKDKAAAETALLDQYTPSQLMRERFLDAAHYPGISIARDYPTGDAVHTLHPQERELDCLKYFTSVDKRSDMCAEFKAELIQHVGADETDSLLSGAKHWAFDPSSQMARRLQKTVADFAVAYDYPGDVIESLLSTYSLKHIVELCDPHTIHCALTITYQMLTCHVARWIESRSNSDAMSGSSVILHRGIHRQAPYSKLSWYEEGAFLASYSLYAAVAEKFVLDKPSNEVAMIISANLPFFAGGILLFSPFVDGMMEDQVEAVVLLGSRPDPIRYDGEHGGGIHEHYLAPAAPLHTVAPFSSSGPRKYGLRPASFDCELHDQKPIGEDGDQGSV